MHQKSPNFISVYIYSNRIHYPEPQLLQTKQGIRLHSYTQSQKFKILSELCQRFKTSFAKARFFHQMDLFKCDFGYGARNNLIQSLHRQTGQQSLLLNEAPNVIGPNVIANAVYVKL